MNLAQNSSFETELVNMFNVPMSDNEKYSLFNHNRPLPINDDEDYQTKWGHISNAFIIVDSPLCLMSKKIEKDEWKLVSKTAFTAFKDYDVVLARTISNVDISDITFLRISLLYLATKQFAFDNNENIIEKYVSQTEYQKGTIVYINGIDHTRNAKDFIDLSLYNLYYHPSNDIFVMDVKEICGKYD